MHGFVSYRRFGKVRSLRSDRAWLELGRYVGPSAYTLGRYVATKLGWRPSTYTAQSLRSDRA
ncbi:hypothetical protein F2Q70_00003698 [Brassica cretica]|uniref:Uncharacterized protein n=1 Tax=Brassica cretica TaxID=69181 RepID=A0A8S9IWU3_BRACR|nr:hypothetical protein F2Q70_00003698 [Brassica cretica]KAF3563278.1 hypothetical protein DY000_02015590 [Brassica cretica]